MTKPMDIMPRGWNEVQDRDFDIVISNIQERIKVQFRIIEDQGKPEGKVGRFLVQRKYPDRYSTLFMFEDEKTAFSWLCGFDTATSYMRLKPAEMYFV